jgi:hypothetical protein
VDPLTEIRIRFDRPMDPESYYLQWNPVPGEGYIEGGFRLRGAIRYEAKNYEFIFPVKLSPGIAHRLGVAADDPRFPPSRQRFFRSADGVAASAHEWQFRTRKTVAPPLATTPKFANESERAAHIADSGRSQSLAALVGSLRQRRRALKSLVERVDDRTLWTDQPTWFRTLQPAGSARFWWQGKSQVRADGSGFFFDGFPLQVGGDDRRCWSRIGDQMVIGPSGSIAQKNVLIADPLRSVSSASDEAVIKELQLEYVGDEQHGGAACHRLRSWDSKTLAQSGSSQLAYCEWLFDAATLLPVLFEKFWRRSRSLRVRLREYRQGIARGGVSTAKRHGTQSPRPGCVGTRVRSAFLECPRRQRRTNQHPLGQDRQRRRHQQRAELNRLALCRSFQPPLRR